MFNLRSLFVSIIIVSGTLAHAQESHQDTLDANGQRAGHAVSDRQSKSAAAYKGIKAPAFSAVDADGKKLALKDLKGRPTLLFFIEKGCPCCKGGKAYYDRIKNYYGDVANIVGFVAGTQEDASKWKKSTTPQFRVLADPGAKIAAKFHATAGLYTILISPAGTIEKTYPGYSQSMLREVTAKIAKMAKIADRHMQVLPAPKSMTTGCDLAMSSM